MRLHVSASLLIGGWDLTYSFYIHDHSSRFKPGCLLMTTTISYTSSQMRVPEHSSFQQSPVPALRARSLDHSLKLSVHLKYNIYQHLQAQHPSWEANVLQRRELQEFRDKIMITDSEETKSRIPEDQKGWYRPGISDLSDVRHTHPSLLPSIRNGHGDSPRRSRLGQTQGIPYVLPIFLPVSLNLN